MYIPEQYFIFISLAVVIIYAVFMILGYQKGFVYELLNLFYTAIALVISWFVAPVLANLYPIFDVANISKEYKALNDLFNLNDIINTVVYFVITFLVLKLLHIIIQLITKSMNKIPVFGKLNQILGICVGFFNATLIVMAISMLFALPLFKNGKEINENTILKYINKYTTEALTVIMENLATDNVKNEADKIDLDIDSYREEFKNWLISIDNNE